MTILSQEGTKINGGNDSRVVSIEGSEGSKWRVVVLKTAFSLAGLKSSLKIDFLFDNVCESEFDISWKGFVSRNSSRWSIEGHISKEVILTWQEHLKELLERESSVTIRVEELDKGIGFRFRYVVDGVVSEEVDNLSAVDGTITASV